MKKILLFFVLVGALNLYADEIISDEQALELGMTEIFFTPQKKIKTENKDEGQRDINDDKINSTLAEVVIIVNESDRSEENPEGQTAKIYHHGNLLHKFDVSSGSRKIKVTTSGRRYIARTPIGYWRPKRAYDEYFSYTFFGAEMPYAIFFYGGIALHGTTVTEMLGTRDSGGCVRFHPEDIKKISELIRLSGDGNLSMKREVLCLDGDTSNCITRRKYLDRAKYHDIDRHTGYLNNKIIWTYDALIVVKSPQG